MKDETKRALLGSIKKWEDIVAGTGKNLGSSNCPLCQRFGDFDPDNPDLCVRVGEREIEPCPVSAKTGKGDCEGSPYYAYERAPSPETAQAEVDFLRSLLPAE
jgi:hypothetical protein